MNYHILFYHPSFIHRQSSHSVSRHSVIVEARHSARDQERAVNQTGNTRALEKLRFMKGQGEAQHRAQICGCLDGRLGSAWGGGMGRRNLHRAWLQSLPNTVRMKCDSEQGSAELEG